MDIILTDKQKYVLYRLVKGLREENLMQQTLGGYAGTGKASANSAMVYTPFGPKKMGEIKLGDQVSNPDGSVAKVIGVFPQGIQQMYKITFIDGASTRVSGDHLWLFSMSSKKYKAIKKYLGNENDVNYELNTTSYLMDYLKQEKTKKRPSWPLVPLTKPIQYVLTNIQPLPIDPYILGLLLGDGYLSSTIGYTSKDKELIDAFKNKGYELNPQDKYGIGYRFVGKTAKDLKEKLKNLDLLGKKSSEKFIPSCYSTASIKDRFAILRGLMDTDGSVDKNGSCEYSSVSESLAIGVQSLIRSLGGKATLSTKIGKYKKNGEIVICQKVYRLHISMSNRKDLFCLNRKKNRAYNKFNGGKSELKNRIIDIQPDGFEECTCIQVDHPNSLYITDDFIVTHNTTVIKYLTKFFPNFAVAAYTGKAANVLRKKGISATTIHSRIYKPYFDNGSVFFDLNPDIGCDGFFIDEASMVPEDIDQDLQSFNVPIIYIGDHGQLEPVDSKFNLMEKPDHTLEEIHRNAGDIARFANHLRHGYAARSFRGTDGSLEFVHGKETTTDELLQSDQIICAFNKTRIQINNQVRGGLGYSGVLNVGERVMCLRNNRQQGLFNGMQGVVINLYTGKYGRKIMDFQFDDTVIEGVWYDPSCFGNESYKVKHGKDTVNPFDYAYCITAHKAQGDEWGNVLVLEQRCRNWEHKRWAYTAASRAKTKLRWKMAT